ncbi:MAG: hypothetical protein M1815_003883 [Lichina confinis]|nr:MAG: hypothetical protein M1815_003883 [Lichina confinis]
MPSIALHAPAHTNPSETTTSSNPLPHLLRTPSGLAILEIQGTLNMPGVHASETGSSGDDGIGAGAGGSVAVGRLVFPDYHPDNSPDDDLRWTKRVYFYVGKHQRMTGEVKKLPKPMAVIRRRAAKRTQEVVDVVEGETQQEDLEIVDLVRWKILFSQRPEPAGM